MAEEPTLPRLVWNPLKESFSSHLQKKRGRVNSDALSSDPPLFSSDDDPSAENYTHIRRKKKYRGPWYQQLPASDSSHDQHEQESARKGKRVFERQFDSGVWMGSDGTDMDEPSEELELKTPASVTVWPRTVPVYNHVAHAWNQVERSSEELAQSQIDMCIENGNETIDLSCRGLTTLSNSAVRPLAAFTRQVEIPSVTEGAFTRLDPTLRIFLGSNSLKSLPAELLNLDRLVVLSLRGNPLQELPPGIGKLRNLKELNIASTDLRDLPYEILDLFLETSRLRSLQLHPNPFFEPRFKPGRAHTKLEDKQRHAWHPQWKLSYRFRTEVRYLDPTGALIKGFTTPPRTSDGYTSLPIAAVNDIPTPPRNRETYVSHVPSLLELALNACVRTNQVPYLSTLLTEDTPAHLPKLLATATAKKASGGSKCTICKRDFIIPRTEWIEWWDIAKVMENTPSAASPLRRMENERDVVERTIPLTRRGCSWLCVPGKVAVVEEHEMDD